MKTETDKKTGWVANLLRFIKHDLFTTVDSKNSKWGWGLRVLKVMVLSVKGFVEYRLLDKASALTYYTVLSLVPVLALFIAVGRGFGIQNNLESFIFELLGEDKEITPFVFEFVNNYLNQVNGGIFMGIGIGLLLWAVVSMFRQIEANFNLIWNVEKNRSIVRQFTTYITILIVIPLLIVFASSVSVQVDTYMTTIAEANAVGSFMKSVYLFFVRLLPYFIYWVLFMLLFIIIPNTKVKVVHALLSGVITGTAFMLLQYLFFNGQISLSRYNAVYGSFAALPMLLIWLQLSWLVVLYGARLCYVSQNLKHNSFEYVNHNISRRYNDYLAVIVLKVIINRFAKGEPPLSINEISSNFNIPVQLLLNHIKSLESIGLVSKINSDDDSDEYYQPAMDINQITYKLLVDRIGQSCDDNIKILDSEEYETVWSNMQNINDEAFAKYKDLLIRDL